MRGARLAGFALGGVAAIVFLIALIQSGPAGLADALLFFSGLSPGVALFWLGFEAAGHMLAISPFVVAGVALVVALAVALVIRRRTAGRTRIESDAPAAPRFGA